MSNATDNPKIEVLKAGGSGVFTNYIYKAIPLAFDESMSYYETLAGLRDYLEKTIIPTVNNNAEAVAELQSLYEKLNKYVDDYFKNLDVQEEINNKLDEMAQDGTLTNLIEDYVNPYIEEQNNNINNIQNQVTSAIVNLNNTITIQNEKIDNIVSPSPAGVYSTLNDLITADPDHNRIYVVSDNNSWYYYNSSSSSWSLGGPYLTSVIETDTTLTSNTLPANSKATGDAIENIKNKLELIVSENKLNPNTMSIGLYYHNGTISQNESYKYSEPIDVVAGDTIYITNKNGGGVTIRELAAFDINDNILENYGATNLQTNYVVPTGVAKIRVSLAFNTFNPENICISPSSQTFTQFFNSYYIIKAPYFSNYVQDFVKKYIVKNTYSQAEIQSFFDMEHPKEIVFEDGEYNFTQPIYVNKNTTIILNNANIKTINVTTFQNFKQTDEILEYNGNGNIKIIGGNIWYGCMLFAHAKNITFENVNFKNANYNHFIQICACKNVKFESCSFNGMAHNVSSISSEMLQLDPCSYTNFPYFEENSESYDNTINKQIVINNCNFIKDLSNTGYTTLVIAIGTHDNTDTVFEDITISNCKFDECSRATIELDNFKNVNVLNNYSKTTNAFIWQFLNASNINILNNIVEDSPYLYKMDSSAILNNLLILNNNLKNCTNGFPFRLYNAQFVKISSNLLQNCLSCVAKFFNSNNIYFNNNNVNNFSLDSTTNGLIICDNCKEILSSGNNFTDISFTGDHNIIFEVNSPQDKKYIESENDILILQ